ncbi:MAG: hypothetical protein KAY24_11730 [Candidatus Eisenbacteria sp.]|nr:hypothetical protein [Candidatus Eisenbacteria bacterium]
MSWRAAYHSIYGEENGEGYLQPLADALGSNLNAGLFRTAYVPVDGFHFYIGIAGMAAPISDDSKTFMARTEDPFTPPPRSKSPPSWAAGTLHR